MELVPAPFELANACLRELLRPLRQMCKWHHLVIAALIEKNRETRLEISLPLFGAPVWRRDDEDASDWFVDRRFRISISLDGYIAGPYQSVENPLGTGGERRHERVVPLAQWRSPHGLEGGG